MFILFQLFRISGWIAPSKLLGNRGSDVLSVTIAAFFGGKNLKIEKYPTETNHVYYRNGLSKPTQENATKPSLSLSLRLSLSLSLSHGKFVTYCKCCKNIISFYTKQKIIRNFENPTCQEAESFNKTILNVSSQGPLSWWLLRTTSYLSRHTWPPRPGFCRNSVKRFIAGLWSVSFPTSHASLLEN